MTRYPKGMPVSIYNPDGWDTNRFYIVQVQPWYGGWKTGLVHVMDQEQVDRVHLLGASRPIHKTFAYTTVKGHQQAMNRARKLVRKLNRKGRSHVRQS